MIKNIMIYGSKIYIYAFRYQPVQGANDRILRL